MDVTKPYEFTGFGAMDVTKPYEFIGLGQLQKSCPPGHSQLSGPVASKGTLGDLT